MTSQPPASDSPFDPGPYIRRPQVDVATAVGLAWHLLVRLPPDAPPEVRRRAQSLRRAAAELQRAWTDAQGRPEDRRPADIAVDNAWAAMEGRLENYTRLPADEFPRAVRAQELLALLFPTGLQFLRLPFEAEWAESQKRLGLIDGHGLDGELGELCGPEFLRHLRAAHDTYGRVLGLGSSTQVTDAPGLLEPLRQLQSAIAAYALQVVATYLEDDANPATAPAVEALLGPLRVVNGRGQGPALEPGTPTMPLPEV
jgi:hypothetical protein